MMSMATGASSTPVQEPLQHGLHRDGRRLTPQRQTILDLFEQIGAGRHLSAEDVHQQLLESDTKVSLATIYRTLRLLVEMGFLQELELSESGRRFELSSGEHRDHHHLVCIRCGRTEEFENTSVIDAGQTAADRHGFELIESTLNVRGVCPNCR